MKNYWVAITLFCLLSCSSFAQAVNQTRVLMIVDQGYRPEEYFQPRKLFEKAGFSVEVAALVAGVVLPSRSHINEVPPIPVDVTTDRVLVQNYDAIVFVGGNGAWNEFLPNTAIHRILIESIHANKVTALICAATGLLATANNFSGETPQFQGRHVTGYFEVEGILRKLGKLNYDGGTPGKPFVVTDGILITGRDPSSAQIFGETVINQIKSFKK